MENMIKNQYLDQFSVSLGRNIAERNNKSPVFAQTVSDSLLKNYINDFEEEAPLYVN